MRMATVVLVVAACGPSLPQTLTGTKVAAIDPLTVTVIDSTGFVRQMTFPNLAAGLDVVSGLEARNPDGDPSVLYLAWIGGRCPSSVTIRVGATAGRVAVSLAQTSQECREQVGVIRAVELSFDRPMPADAVDATRTDQ
jgi:hypothetical protein